MAPEAFCLATVAEVHRAYQSGRLTVRQLTAAFQMRIERLDRGPEGLHAVLELNPDAAALAAALDARLAAGERPAGLFGIPVLLKDNIDTGDRMHTSAGTLALAEHCAAADAPLVRKLRTAGALLLGKANMTELANYMSWDAMPAGYSARGGQVRNPHNRSRSPGGSSSGCAAALAAGLCTLAVGTETCGSILSPAGCCGVVGLKPTQGLVETGGIVPISATLDTAGPMARTVADAAVLLGALTGRGDAYTHALQPGALSGLRIGVNRAPDAVEPPGREKQAAFERLCQALAAAGATLVEHTDLAGSAAIGSIMFYEFQACLNRYLADCGPGAGARSLAQLIAWNQAHAPAALRYGQDLLLAVQRETDGRMTQPAYRNALATRTRCIDALDRLLDRHALDLMLCLSDTALAALTGFPALTIPIGTDGDGVPLDSCWIARRGDERTLLRAAYAAEAALACVRFPAL